MRRAIAGKKSPFHSMSERQQPAALAGREEGRKIEESGFELEVETREKRRLSIVQQNHKARH